VHALADELAPAAAEQRLELFFELLLGLLARTVRAAATGAGMPEEVKFADRLGGHGRLASMAELWETLAREKAEAAALNLDRKSLVLGTFARLEAAARS
jgi:DNA polymerase-3 subunit delta'